MPSTHLQIFFKYICKGWEIKHGNVKKAVAKEGSLMLVNRIS
jgi:hypothetical protein